MHINRDQALLIIAVCVAEIAYLEVVRTIDAANTNSELRLMAADTRRANGYLVRAAYQRKHFWQR